MNVRVEKLPKSTVRLIVTVPNAKVKQAYEKLLDVAVEQTLIEGFRKGKAPRELVKDKVGVSKLYADVINDILQSFYPQAVKENHIAAVANPKVELKEFDIDKDLEFTADVAVRPEVKIGDYKKTIKEGYDQRLAEAKKQNEDRLKKGEKIEDLHVHLSTNEIIDALVATSETEVSDLLIADETERMMSRLINQAQTIGLSLDQYLKAQNKSGDELKKEYAKIAEKNLIAEFAMGKLVMDNNIEVTDEEIADTIKASGLEDWEKRMEDPIEKYYVKSILQKNKLLSNLIQEIEGENHHEH